MANDLIKQGIELFNSEKYAEAIQKLDEALKTANNPQQQVNVQYWLGRCYFDQALQTNDTILFDKARGHFEKRLVWAEQLSGEKIIEKQGDTQYWLGRCYFEQALQIGNAVLFDMAREHFQKRLVWAEQLSGEKSIEKQGYAQHWLGRCYFEQALQIGNAVLFDMAREHFQKRLVWAKQLNGNNSIEKQIIAQFWLGRCYLKQAKQNQGNIEQSEDYLSEAEKCFDEVSKLVEKSKDKSFKKQAIAKLRRDFRELDFVKGNYEGYFKSKQEHIQQKLSKNKKINGRLKENIAAVLAVLSIDPIEFDKPLAHYTSPAVCEKLLGIGQKESKQENIVAGKMRMNSSAYMNDPYEGKSLYDLLGIQEPDLENLSELSRHNAFFACFSSRVNDLNQFRLYGKVGNVEASGCCLVLNRRGNWIREPDLEASFHRLNDQDGFTGSVVKETTAQRPSENLPLYQIAYIFYRDEYTQDKEYDVMDGKTDFGIRLKPISDNLDWHEVRKQQLQTALKGLCGYWKDTDQSKEEFQENKAALEYIRYLFKDHAFRDEEEFRLLQIEEIGSDKVQYCPDTNTAFLEYGNVCTRLDEVILGTNYERTNAGLKVEVFRHLLKRKQPHIKVRHSSLPINPPNRY
ncbi:tetratricopeptide repeat protein [Neisseria bacilliformis]|uniref:tetratricopeptide repeat protein n=1 Tax=Neisseria bacilliformis TaxID=267212 RepID=UPI0028EE6C96|nr:tetratricopeptide repeat protein [Neisseria bacilliformis]